MQAWRESGWGWGWVCACLFSFCHGISELGAYFYKTASSPPVQTGCNCQPGTVTNAAGG